MKIIHLGVEPITFYASSRTHDHKLEISQRIKRGRIQILKTGRKTMPHSLKRTKRIMKMNMGIPKKIRKKR